MPEEDLQLNNRDSLRTPDRIEKILKKREGEPVSKADLGRAIGIYDPSWGLIDHAWKTNLRNIVFQIRAKSDAGIYSIDPHERIVWFRDKLPEGTLVTFPSLWPVENINTLNPDLKQLASWSVTAQLRKNPSDAEPIRFRLPLSPVELRLLAALSNGYPDEQRGIELVRAVFDPEAKHVDYKKFNVRLRKHIQNLADRLRTEPEAGQYEISSNYIRGDGMGYWGLRVKNPEEFKSPDVMVS